MAIIRTSALVAAVSGSIGGVNFAVGKHGTVARLRGRRIPTTTKVLLDQQALFANVTRTWRSLTNQQRSSWRSLAPAYPSTNRLGQTSPLSGYTLFLKVALRGVHIWGWQFLDPPEVNPAPTLDAFGSAFDDAGDYNVTFDISAPPYLVRLQIWGARHFSTVAPKFITRWREVAIVATGGGTASAADVRDGWEAVFGTMEIGEAYSLKAVLSNSCIEMLPPPALQTTGIVVTS